MKIEVEVRTREEYFAAAEEREAELRQLDALIREVAPHLEPVLAGGMSGKMLGYGIMSYKSKSMKEATEAPLISLAAQKNHISLYICAVENGEYIAEKLQDKLGKVSCGKSCIRFKKVEDLNLDTVKNMLKDLDKRFESGEKLYGF